MSIRDQAVALPRADRTRLIQELQWSLAREAMPDEVTPKVFAAFGALGFLGGLGVAKLGVLTLICTESRFAEIAPPAASLFGLAFLMLFASGFLFVNGLQLWEADDRRREAELR